MKVLQNYIKRRRENHLFYKELFKDIEGTKVLEETSTDTLSNHWLSCVLLNKEKETYSGEELRIVLQNNNIESIPFWKPLYLLSVFKNYDYYGANVSEALFNKGLCLPSGSNVTKDDLDRIENSINNFS